jgi:hypothetical protein
MHDDAERLDMKAVAATVVAVALVAAGVAIAAIAGSRGEHSTGTLHAAPAGTVGKSDIAAAADYLGISNSELRRRLRSGSTLAQVAAATSGRSVAALAEALVASKAARLKAAVASGQVAPAKARARLLGIRRRAAAELNRVSAPGVGLGVGGYVPASSRYLGIPPAQLRAKLRGGSLAQIAGATAGKSVNGLIEALVSARKAKLDALAASGGLTPPKEARRLAALHRRVTVAVNRVPTASATGTAGAEASGQGEAEAKAKAKASAY